MINLLFIIFQQLFIYLFFIYYCCQCLPCANLNCQINLITLPLPADCDDHWWWSALPLLLQATTTMWYCISPESIGGVEQSQAGPAGNHVLVAA